MPVSYITINLADKFNKKQKNNKKNFQKKYKFLFKLYSRIFQNCLMKCTLNKVYFMHFKYFIWFGSLYPFKHLINHHLFPCVLFFAFSFWLVFIFSYPILKA